MVDISQKKVKPLIKTYVIYTTKELNEKRYGTQEITIEGAFVKFKPNIEVNGEEVTEFYEEDDFRVILPQTVIKEIRYVDQELTMEERSLKSKVYQ